MRVVVPFTELRLETTDALDATGHPWEPHDVSGDTEAYWRLLRDLWSDGEGFIVVEHDIVVTPEALASLEACASHWCSCPYRYMGGPYHGLGCTKFTSAVMSLVPDALDRVAGMSDPTHPERHWCRLDAWMAQVLHGAGVVRCTNHDLVGHPDTPPSHGCIGGRT